MRFSLNIERDGGKKREKKKKERLAESVDRDETGVSEDWRRAWNESNDSFRLERNCPSVAEEDGSLSKVYSVQYQM